jgi:Flp pilus assembly protein TadD
VDRNRFPFPFEFRAALAARRDDVAAHTNLASALVLLGDLDGAADEYRAALALNPKHLPARYNLGVVLVNN